MLDINKSVLCAANIYYRASDLIDNFAWLEFPYVEICALFLPNHLLDVLLDRIDNAIYQETWQKGQIVVTEFNNKLFEVSIGVVANYAFDSAIFGSKEKSSCCSHASSP